DFLRNLPSKLLVADLYEKWLLALERPSHEERIAALKEVAAELPSANLLLLRRLLSLLHHISESAESNKMHARNLAICVGPSMLSLDTDSVLPLDVQRARNDKVTLLVEFLICHHADLFGEELPLPCTPSAEEGPKRVHSSTEHSGAARPSASARQSPEAAAGGSGAACNVEQPNGVDAPAPSPRAACVSAPPLAPRKNHLHRLRRSFSEPDLSSLRSVEGEKWPSEENTREDHISIKEQQLRSQKLAPVKTRSSPAFKIARANSLPQISTSCSPESSFGAPRPRSTPPLSISFSC
ncbi:PREDICTED: T-cell activation Rho GTPase-activating protein-like, partial [Tinamus guttatus]|uniref:T-cell activation Rho GTPase-activating protein-like n=1 Tax=Tinamus guttatus TaxID=94827 RepID=UPI00052ED743